MLSIGSLSQPLHLWQMFIITFPSSIDSCLGKKCLDSIAVSLFTNRETVVLSTLVTCACHKFLLTSNPMGVSKVMSWLRKLSQFSSENDKNLFSWKPINESHSNCPTLIARRQKAGFKKSPWYGNNFWLPKIYFSRKGMCRWSDPALNSILLVAQQWYSTRCIDNVDPISPSEQPCPTLTGGLGLCEAWSERVGSMEEGLVWRQNAPCTSSAIVGRPQMGDCCSESMTAVSPTSPPSAGSRSCLRDCSWFRHSRCSLTLRQ